MWFRRYVATLLVLCVGTVLPGCSFFGGGEPERTIDYPVRRGDTLSSIASRYSVSVDTLVDLNDLDDPNQLEVGQVLKLPYRGYGAGPVGRPAMKPEESSVKSIRLSAARRYIGRLIWPAPRTKLVSKFGPRWMNFHEGLDLAGPIGTPIYAVIDGQVVYSGNGIRGYGNIVVIRSPDILHVYAHNDRNLVDVGEKVQRGDVIAEIGQTGHVTGPHVHFEIRIKDKNGKNVAIDPMVFYP